MGGYCPAGALTVADAQLSAPLLDREGFVIPELTSDVQAVEIPLQIIVAS